ncbi:hypothetical protein PC9H_010813 [Pleurotus ostreatus]|uniref:THIF-type NAD/FAD binding fold domain-containing protein n=1 Tax=Pleurotus ostreatus TaxID=5322 RepID=A0A8H6ZKG2_PLEOS|nr:uncharacterized protein PC9H_010813 [Pleurotus ostreatus]KAF7422657.1 hypothetical protein PC9H_010813 [Pleurotus ostreatus]
MTDQVLGNKSIPVQITEDEAAVYDRQIRLWGLEAQQRMRNATIVVVCLRGTATETIKNIVLAGIGKLIIIDGEDVTDADLGSGFFFRDEDGKKRVDAAKARVESLNPLVKDADLVCVTDWRRDGLIQLNEVCRRLGKPLYAGGTFGLFGYIFCDLLNHEYIAPDRSVTKDGPKNVRMTTAYSTLHMALQHKWSGLTKRQTKELNPAVVYGILAVWEFQSLHGGSLPDSSEHADELEAIANKLLSAADVNKQVATAIPRTLIETLSTTAQHEFSPVCAVVGGMLAQDILKALAAREPPIANFFTFDGDTGGGTVCRMNMP